MTLERRYRRLLLAYPRAYRQRRGDEMVATLLDDARQGQRRPGRRAAWDLVSGGLRERIGLHNHRGYAGGLALVAPVCLTLAAGYAVSYWFMGARSIASSAVTLAWIVAVVLRYATSRPSNLPTAVALVSTVGALAIGYFGPPVSALFIASAAWGTLAFAGGLAAGPGKVHGLERWGVPVAVAAAAATTWWSSFGGTAIASESELPPPIWAGIVLPALGLVALVGGMGYAQWRQDNRFAWASLALFVGLAPTLLHFSVWWRVGDVPSVIQFGRTNLVILGALSGLVLLLVRGGHARGSSERRLQTVGSVALGFCAASSAIVLTKVLADAPPRSAIGIVALSLAILVAALDPWLAITAQRIAVAFALTALCAASFAQPSTMEPAFAGAAATLLLVGLLTRQRGARSWSSIWAMLGSAATIMLLVWIRYERSLPRQEVQTWLMVMLAAFLLAAVAICAAVSVLRAGQTWWPAAAAFAASLLWLVGLSSWTGGVTAVAATGLLVAARFVARRARHGQTPGPTIPTVPETA